MLVYFMHSVSTPLGFFDMCPVCVHVNDLVHSYVVQPAGVNCKQGCCRAIVNLSNCKQTNYGPIDKLRLFTE